jgi:ElaB/YqjD/DUF883 family membrane-anchored ribosome-binding protein
VAENPDQIKRHIETQRERLGENLDILQHEMKRVTDWRTWVGKKPLIALGVALAGGLWLGTRGR